MGDISKNFDKSEFVCKCGCGKYNLNPVLLDALQRLRDYIGYPIYINSGCRCEKHNKVVGGVKNSLHVRGKAADIRVDELSPQELAKSAMEIKEFRDGGIGIYTNFVHVDVRGRKARWRG